MHRMGRAECLNSPAALVASVAEESAAVELAYQLALVLVASSDAFAAGQAFARREENLKVMSDWQQ
jgi:hypothetical protein